MSLGVSQLYEFDKFRLDTQERVLWCNGQLVPLTSKLLKTLIVLVERHGHFVDKQELLERVWPSTFVEEANVARHVSRLAKTLGKWTDISEIGGGDLCKKFGVGGLCFRPHPDETRQV